MLIDIVRCRCERRAGLLCNICAGRLCSGSACSEVNVPCAAHTLAYCAQIDSHIDDCLIPCDSVRTELERICYRCLIGYGYRSACCRYGQCIVGDIRRSERVSVACSLKRVEEVGLCTCIAVADPYLIRRCSCSSRLSCVTLWQHQVQYL